MWATELSHVNTVADAIQFRNRKYATVDTLIYALMSLRQESTPPPRYYFSVHCRKHGILNHFLVIVGMPTVNGRTTGDVHIRIVLHNRFHGQLFLDIHDSRTGVLRNVIEGDWNHEAVRHHLCRHLMADQEYAVDGAYDGASRRGKTLFRLLVDHESQVSFRPFPSVERRFGISHLPPPVARKSRTWKRSPTLHSTGLPNHITGTRVRPRRRSPSPKRNASPPRSRSPPPPYESQLTHSPSVSRHYLSMTGTL